MRSLPVAADLLSVVAEFVRDNPHPIGFHVQVASNALAIADREMRKRSAVDRGIIERLSLMLDQTGESVALERELAHRIAAGTIVRDTPGLIDHLWATVIGELEIDQPNYATLKHLRSHGERS